MRILFYIILSAGFVSLVSCSKWLDVKPKTEIESEANFSNQQGFRDALTGVYLNMSNESLYGKEMTLGLVDVLANQYSVLSEYGDYYETSRHNYKDEFCISKVNQVWTGSYFSIANLNNLLTAINQKDTSFFDRYMLQVIKGEALGLRALHHFDMLRLFAPSPKSKGGSASAIPYRLDYGPQTVTQSTITQVINLALNDVNNAIGLLKNNDPIVSGTTVPTTTTGYLRNRQYKFNYYAALALKARIHLYAGNMDSARDAAMEVINSNKFPATTLSAISGGNRLLSTEIIFNINVNNIAAISTGFFNYYMETTKSTDEWKDWFELTSGGSGDYRYLYQTVQSGTDRYVAKYEGSLNTNATATKRVPLFRLSEMYYIVAESYLGVDNPAAVGWLNKARTNRNLGALPTSLSADDILPEIIKEYQKEFLAEGQLFYLYKRLNMAAFPYYQGTIDDAVYVLPMPDDEIIYGQIK